MTKTSSCSTTTTATTNRIARIGFNVGYYLIGTIQLLAGGLGMVYPFGILGDYTIFYSDDFASSSSPPQEAAITEVMAAS